MKKNGLVFVCAMIVTVLCGFFAFDFNNINSVEAYDIQNLPTEYIYETIKLDKSISKDELLNKINADKSEGVSAAAYMTIEETNPKELSYEEVAQICEENDYSVMLTDYGYEIYYKFQLKSIFVENTISDDYGARKVVDCGEFVILKFETEEETKLAFETLESQNKSVVTDQIVRLSAVDNFTTGDFNSWGAEAMGIDVYQDYYATNGSSKEVVVAVIDSGINTSHELFQGRLLKNNGRVVGFCADAVTTRYTYSGYSFEDDNTHGYNKNGNLIETFTGHGTHVAGTISELTPTNVKILPMKVFDYTGSGSFGSIYEALEALINNYSLSYDIVAINMSLGGTFSETKAAEINNYISTLFNQLRNKKAIAVVAAGNEKEETKYKAPGGCGDSAIVVSALKQNGTGYIIDSAYSNYGSSVDIAAPGTGILSAGISKSATTSSSNAYKTLQGTSMATPHVTAAVALLRLDSLRENESITQLEQRLFDSAIDMGTAGKDVDYGHGMLSLKNFNGNISYTATNTVATYNGSYHNISVSVSGVNNATIKYGLTASDCNISDITTNNVFKNWTNGAKTIYFKISATGYLDTIGYKTLTINKANVGIQVGSQYGIYGNTPNLNNNVYSISSGTVYNSDDLGVSLTTTATSTSLVGYYQIKATITNTNYNLTYNVSNLNYEVKKRNVTIKLLSQESEYGDAIQLDNSAYTVSQQTPLVNGDNLQVELQTNATSSSVVGNGYKITLKNNNANYLVSSDEAVYTITPKQLIILMSKSSNYGDPIDTSTTNLTVRDSKDNTISLPNINLTVTCDIDEKSPAGTYTNKLVFATNNSNYAITSNTTYYIYRRSITIMPIQKEVTYGDALVLDNSQWTVTYGSIVNGDVIPVTLTTTYTSSTNCGTYTGAISSSVDTTSAVVKNYSVACAKGTVIVNKRDVTIKPDVHSSVYGANIVLNNSNWHFASGNAVNGDTFNVVLSTNAKKGNPVGEDYLISLTATEPNGKHNYNISLETNAYIITPKDIKITISNQDSVFGRDIELKNRYTLDAGYGLEYGDILNITTSTTATSVSSIGEYPITFVAHDNANYNIIQATSGVLFIKGREVVITLLDQIFNYGDEIVLNSTKIQSNEDISSFGIVLTTTANKFSNVGKYEIIATSSNTNVVLSYDGANKLIINPRMLNVFINNQTHTYGEIDLDMNAYTTSGAANGEDVDIELYTDAEQYSNVGNNYKINARTFNSNYTLLYTQATLTITAKALTITLDNQRLYYSMVILNQDAYTLSQNPYNNDDLSIQILTDDANSNVGNNYEIYFSFENENYIVTGENATLIIDPLPIQIEILQEVEYGNPYIFDKTNYRITSEHKVVEGDDLNLEMVSHLDSTSGVNNYNIDVVANNSNYSVTVVSAQVAVTKKSITIIAPQLEKEYGEVVDTASLQAEIDGLVDGDEIEISFALDQDYLLGVGDYDITFTYSGEDIENYQITKENGNLKVVKRYVKIKIEAQIFGYNEPIEFENLYNDVEGRIINGDNLNIKLSTTAKKGDPVGRYAITYSYDNDNYDVEFIENYVYIEEGDLIVELLPQTFVYGEEINLNNLEFNVINSEIDKHSLGIVLSTNAKKYDAVGDSYTINGICTNANYQVTILTTYLKITQRPVSITLENQELEYGNAKLNTSKFVLLDTLTSSAINNSQVQVSLESGATNTSDVTKTYPITFKWANKNYLVTALNSAIVSIRPRNIAIESIQEGVYGSNPELNSNKYTIKNGSIVNEDDLMIRFSTNATKLSGVNNYSLFIDDCNKNYNVELNANSKFVVRPKNVKIEIEKEKYYGDPIELNNIAYTITSGSLVGDDSLNLDLRTTATQNSPVAEYPITIENYNKNYLVNLERGVLKVCPRIIVIEAIKKGEYGDYFALDNTYEIKEGSLANATDDLGIKFSVPTANNQSKIGNYDLVMTYTNKNYDVEMNYLSHFEIVPRKLTFELENQSGTYGDEVIVDQNAFKLKYGTIVNYDNVPVTLLTTAQQGSNAGTYLLYGEIDNPNYTAKFNNATYTINKRPITIKLNKQRTARGLTFEVDQNAWELVNGELLEGDTINVQIYTNAKKLSMIGNYKLMATVNSDNYDVQVIEGKLFLNISFIDVAVVVIVIAVIAVIIVKVVKRRKEKQDNQKLFDKWIKW